MRIFIFVSCVFELGIIIFILFLIFFLLYLILVVKMVNVINLLYFINLVVVKVDNELIRSFVVFLNFWIVKCWRV